MIRKRTEEFWQRIEETGKQSSAFLLSHLKNIFYLTGFTGEGILLSSPEDNYLITDSRYTEQAKQEAGHCQIIIQEMKQSDAQTESLCQLVGELKIKELGFESEALPVSSYLKYQNRMPHITLQPFQKTIETMRMIKDPIEIELMKKSAQIATHSFAQTIDFLHDGVTERSLAARLNYTMRNNGAQKEAFDLIITSGERGTLIHGGPTEKKIREGELIIIDFGCIYGMYHSDCTRSLLLGGAGKEKIKIFEIIKSTQLETLQQVRPGAKCSDLDDFARRMIDQKGYGEYFSHSLGHGVGLDIHELPRLSQYDQTILQSGMVITIEPGIYVPGIGGVRIEDTVLVTEKGCQILTSLPKALSVSDYIDQH